VCTWKRVDIRRRFHGAVYTCRQGESKQGSGFMPVLRRTIPIGARILLFRLRDAFELEIHASIRLAGMCRWALPIGHCRGLPEDVVGYFVARVWGPAFGLLAALCRLGEGRQGGLKRLCMSSRGLVLGRTNGWMEMQNIQYENCLYKSNGLNPHRLASSIGRA
jgi:hypothetical protein